MDKLEDAYYFGCIKQHGHYLWNKNEGSVSPYNFPIKKLDGGFLPKNSAEGVVYLTSLAEWTIINFADFSVDERPGSHSLFLLKGTLSYEEAIEKAKKAFPQIFQRFKFELRKAK